MNGNDLMTWGKMNSYPELALHDILGNEED